MTKRGASEYGGVYIRSVRRGVGAGNEIDGRMATIRRLQIAANTICAIWGRGYEIDGAKMSRYASHWVIAPYGIYRITLTEE
jgi:hypothetical protein